MLCKICESEEHFVNFCKSKLMEKYARKQLEMKHLHFTVYMTDDKNGFYGYSQWCAHKLRRVNRPCGRSRNVKSRAWSHWYQNWRWGFKWNANVWCNPRGFFHLSHSSVNEWSTPDLSWYASLKFSVEQVDITPSRLRPHPNQGLIAHMENRNCHFGKITLMNV